MKKITHFLLVMLCFVNSMMANVDVTFRVNMQGQTVSPNGVHLAGSFHFNPSPTYPEWNPSGILMTDANNDGIYEVTLSLNEGYYFEYKFINGNNWPFAENVPGGCQNNGNRFINVPTSSVVLQTVCFASCVNCPGADNVDVTFRVNMQNEVVDPNGIHLAGSFHFNPFPVYPEWDPAAIEMTDLDMDDVYEVTLSLNPGYYFEYKFVNGNSWTPTSGEIVPVECQANNNRFMNVDANDMILPVVCFSSCTNCLTPGCTDPDATNFNALASIDNGSCLFQVDLSVDLNYYPTVVSGVSVIGSFNAWNNTSNPLSDPENDGIWSTSLLLPNGFHEYLFNIPELNVTELMSSADPCVVENGGNFNREFSVSGSSFSLPVYCWNSCYACASVEVVFSVNMIGEAVAPEGVFLAGSFNGWQPTLMTDNGNGVWSLPWNLQNGNYYTYKFVNGDVLDTDAENIFGSCTVGAFGDRYLTAPFDAAVLPTVCYGECSECPISVNVRFRVDMANENVSPSGVHLAGSFQGWDPATTSLTFIGYTIYEVTLSLNPYTYYEYKFINGNAWGQDENLSSDCTNNFNRYFNTGFQDIDLPIVCFGQCGMCAGCTDPFAAEYSPFAVVDDGSCNSPMIWGCTYPSATNYNADVDIDDGSCVFPPSEDLCPADFNDDGIIGVSDLLSFISVYGTVCP